MKLLKNISKGIFMLVVLTGCQNNTSNSVNIRLINTSDKNLVDKAIVIERSQLGEVKDSLFPVISNEREEVIASQLDDTNSDGKWDELFLVTNISANDTLVFTLDWTAKKLEYNIRTNVRFGKRDSEEAMVHPKTSDTLMANQVYKALGYQPYQTDGPSWENDKVGFRHYFDGRNSNDFFGKKAAYMSPDTVGISETGGVEDNYHVMRDWGRDVLAVGNSAGIGGFELMTGDKITRLGITNNDSVNNIERTIFNIVSKGPVRSIMNFNYFNWQVDGRLYTANETTSIWPGMYGYQNTISLSGLHGDETLLVGLVNSNTDKGLVEYEVGDYVVLYTHDKQTYDKVWYLGLALILPKASYLGYGEAPEEGSFTKSFYGKLKIEQDKPVSYYALGCWEIADSNFIDETYFKNYLSDVSEQLSAKVKVEIE